MGNVRLLALAALAGLCIPVTPAWSQSAPAACKTRSDPAAKAIGFPRGEASDVEFARAMVPAAMPQVTAKLPTAASCLRKTFQTSRGDYQLRGENSDLISRTAVRPGGGDGEIFYLVSMASDPKTKLPVQVLVLHFPGAESFALKFYTGIPSDDLLASDIARATQEIEPIFSVNAQTKFVQYGFSPTGGAPSPVQSGTTRDATGAETKTVAGPQVFYVGDAMTAGHIKMDGGKARHAASGLSCPDRFDGQQVLLMRVTADNDSLHCEYRHGTELRYDPNDEVRYDIKLARRPARTAQEIAGIVGPDLRSSNPSLREAVPALAAGASPAPATAQSWISVSNYKFSLWTAKKADWIMISLATYAPTAENDKEAASVVKRLFETAFSQVR